MARSSSTTPWLSSSRDCASRIHQLAPAALQRQRLGGNQERRGGAQTSGLQPHPTALRPQVNAFCQAFLNPYVNFHRPCFFAEVFIDEKGKTRKRYPFRNMMTPYEKLKSLPKARRFLKPGITFKQLDAVATAMSDNEAARRLNQARTRLFQSITRSAKHAA